MDELLAEVPRGLMAAWAALFGATVGSFLNVVIARVPAGQSVVAPRSRCPRCGQPIAWYDNVPVLSWVLLRARCRACRAPISVRYPLVELAGGLAAWMAFQRHGPTPRALAEFALVALLLALAAIDLDTWLLPHALTWPLIGLGLAASALGVAPARSLASAALGGALGFGGFALVSLVGERVFKKEALGFGDVYLLAGLGSWLGAGALLPVVLLASLQGSVVGVVLLFTGRSQPGPEPEVGPEPAPAAPPLPVATPEAYPGPEDPGPGTTTVEPGAGSATERPGSSDFGEHEEAPWVPPRHALPFGPFLVAAALEWLWLGDRLGAAIPVLGVFR